MTLYRRLPVCGSPLAAVRGGLGTVGIVVWEVWWGDTWYHRRLTIGNLR